jgi:hypothetical protein
MSVSSSSMGLGAHVRYALVTKPTRAYHVVRAARQNEGVSTSRAVIKQTGQIGHALVDLGIAAARSLKEALPKLLSRFGRRI